MDIKVIPVHIEIDLKNPEQPLKVQYIVELSTEVYNDVMSSGMTYIADETVFKAVQALTDAVSSRVHVDLGLEQPNLNTKTTPKQEEDL